MRNERSIDLNADVGEGCGNDAALFGLVSSANIACGWHAGDESTMRETVRAAVKKGVAIGAHPSYPDRENFGRTPMQRAPDKVYEDIVEQLRALNSIVVSEDAKMTHVKPHGALYNAAARDPQLADAIAKAVRDFDPSLALVGLARGAAIDAARRYGLHPIEEIFADRRYTADGQLVARGTPQALIDDPHEAVQQTLKLLERNADTVCLHGDGAHALEFAAALRAALVSAGIEIKSFSQTGEE